MRFATPEIVFQQRGLDKRPCITLNEAPGYSLRAEPESHWLSRFCSSRVGTVLVLALAIYTFYSVIEQMGLTQ